MVIRSRNPVEQAAEVVRRYGLARRVKPFSRCLNCSGMLEPAGGFAGLTEDERLVIPARVRGWCDEYTTLQPLRTNILEGYSYREDA